ncbi:MFS transporter [Pseudomonadota bacterium]
MADKNTDSSTGIKEQSYGWVVVGVATIAQALAFGANITVSVLINPWELEFGWPRADISLAYGVITIGAALGGIIFGTLSDRVGYKRIAFLGATVMGFGLMGLSWAEELWIIYIIYFTTGLFGFACVFTPLLALSGLWFHRRKGLALGIVTAGGAVGQGFVPLIFRYMISADGWRDATFNLGLAYLIILVPLLYLLRPPPVLQSHGSEISKSNANLWRLSHKITLPWLACAGIFCCICMAVPLVHLVPLATDAGFTPERATSILFVLMVSGMVGRIIFGTVADHIGGLPAYFVASFGQTASVFWFTQTQSLFTLYLLAVLFGFFFAGVMTSLLICAREAAPLRIAGFAAAIVSTTAWIGMGIGSYQAGYFYDSTGTYTLSYGNAVLAGIINLLIVAVLVWYRRRHTRFRIRNLGDIPT